MTEFYSGAARQSGRFTEGFCLRRLQRTVYDWRHYLAVIQRKPGAPRDGAPFLELPDTFKQLQHHLFAPHRWRSGDGGDPVLQHDEQAVLVAAELALEDGVPSKGRR